MSTKLLLTTTERNIDFFFGSFTSLSSSDFHFPHFILGFSETFQWLLLIQNPLLIKIGLIKLISDVNSISEVIFSEKFPVFGDFYSIFDDFFIILEGIFQLSIRFLTAVCDIFLVSIHFRLNCSNGIQFLAIFGMVY